MAEEIKELIAKIQTEGIQQAENKAKAIEAEAKRRAEIILEEARKESAKIISIAKEDSAKMEEAGRLALKQAARDSLLNLRKEINRLLDKIILMRVSEALGPQELQKLINSLFKEHAGEEKAGAVISLKKEDLEKLEKGFLQELKEKVKSGITLKSTADISGGFTISFDSGKSHLDFTDHALAEYLSSLLKPKLAELLKEIAK